MKKYIVKHSFAQVLRGPINLEASTNNSLKPFSHLGATLTIILSIETHLFTIILIVI